MTGKRNIDTSGAKTKCFWEKQIKNQKLSLACSATLFIK